MEPLALPLVSAAKIMRMMMVKRMMLTMTIAAVMVMMMMVMMMAMATMDRIKMMTSSIVSMNTIMLKRG